MGHDGDVFVVVLCLVDLKSESGSRQKSAEYYFLARPLEKLGGVDVVGCWGWFGSWELGERRP